MTCRDFLTFLIDYLDGGLDETERTRFDAHLRVCPGCQNYLQAYRETVKLGRLVLADADAGTGLPSDVPPELIEAILSARRGQS
jgi:anti-sigma factor RsiW